MIVRLVLLTMRTAYAWTYAAESEVQACRDLLSSNMVQIYVNENIYILTNVLLDDEEQPIYFRGTRTLKLSEDMLEKMATMLDQMALDKPPYYKASPKLGASSKNISTAPNSDFSWGQYFIGMAFGLICCWAAIFIWYTFWRLFNLFC